MNSLARPACSTSKKSAENGAKKRWRFHAFLHTLKAAPLYRAVERPASEIACHTHAPFILPPTIVLLVHIIQGLTTQSK